MGVSSKIKNWIETRYLFVIRREEDFSVIQSFSITRIKITLLAFLFLLTSLIVSLTLSRTLLARWLDPVYQETENTERIFALSEIVDSLYYEVQAKDQYVENILKLMSGGHLDTTGTVINEPSAGVDRNELDLYKSGTATERIRKEFESMPLDESSFRRLGGSFSTTYFFPPLKGVITSKYNVVEGHFGVDVVAAENEPVKAIAQGTVIFSTWTLETGYNIGVQHSNELVSIYKHNSVLLKQVGDPVKGGEIISIIGNTGEQTSGHHLHLELWYKGTPLNPQEFITFD
ncbi:M23 family metallopeptidase [Anditalea andensis]|uniref:Peptidase M23 n=1 Tax=Anditalea andensis TaxID=1048983 RepID=A0A074LH12_9BACT|nr:peptidoglycan DD-metalloendopeptidase family protein [Anditalea andensis]KEO73067.1 peptidase M23 [Anditalea andensis]